LRRRKRCQTSYIALPNRPNCYPLQLQRTSCLGNGANGTSKCKYTGLVIGLIVHLQLGTTSRSNCNAAQTITTHNSLLSMLQPPLVVAWSQSSNKGYSSLPCSLRTALTNRRLKTVLLCPWPPRQGPGPPFSDCLRTPNSLKVQTGSPYIAFGRTPHETLLLSVTLLMCLTLCDVSHSSVTVCLTSGRVENTASRNSSIVALPWRRARRATAQKWICLQSRYLAVDAFSSSSVPDLSSHATALTRCLPFP
jgi:hypothetical protein